MKNYEFIEHTADIGIRLKAGDLRELFKNAALAVFDIVTEKKETKSKERKEIKIRQKADALEELFINWLNELISLSVAKGLIFSDFKIKKLDENNLEATITGEPVKNYKINTEIKAATYHDLEIKKQDSGWIARVIFDV